MPGAVSSEELAGWRSEESWGDRIRVAGVPGGALRRVRGGLPWRQGQQTAKRRGRRVSPPCRWLQMGNRGRRQADRPQAWAHTDLSPSSFCLVGRFLLQD